MIRAFILIAFSLFATRAPAQIAQMLPPIPPDERADWIAVGQLARKGQNNRGICTGTLISADKVITAAHCVASRAGYPFAPQSITFFAGRNGDEAAAKRRVAKINIHPGYIVTEGVAKAAYDVAVLTLEKPIPARRVQPYPLKSGPISGGSLTVLGYHNRNPGILNGRSDCRILELQPAFMGLSCNVISGNSGGPVLQRVGPDWFLVGVVTSKVGYAGGPGPALAARIGNWAIERRDKATNSD